MDNKQRNSLKPIIKWSGGKRGELDILRSFYPENIKRVIEPFCGGGAVSFDLNCQNTILNDVSKELTDFYKTIQDKHKREKFISCLEIIDKSRKEIDKSISTITDEQLADMFEPIVKTNNANDNIDKNNWLDDNLNNFIKNFPLCLQEHLKEDIQKSVLSKTKTRVPNLEKKQQKVFTNKEDHLKTAINAGIYTTLRRIYNKESLIERVENKWIIASWYSVRILCYSGMFRYNKEGKFNVPYGGIGYNTRDFSSIIENFKDKNLHKFLSRCAIYNKDFENLFKEIKFEDDDFLFIDPPYDSAFSQYNSMGDFTKKDQKRLAQSLIGLDTNWMLVIKNTPFILDLYKNKNLNIKAFAKNYQVNIKNRHDRDVEHLIITNYKTKSKLNTQNIRIIE